jgi:hypothetical protein
MDFKITTLHYPSGWVAIAQKGLLTFISEYYREEVGAREDVTKQVNEYISQPRYNILDRDENVIEYNLSQIEVNDWLSGRNKSLYLLEKI